MEEGFKQTEVGEIPSDWEVIPFSEIADKSKKWSITGGPFGSNLKKSDYTTNGVQIIQLQNIGDGVFYNDYQIYTSEKKADELLSCNIYPEELILSKMGDPVARVCFVPKGAKRYLMASDGIRLVVDKKEFSKRFVHDYINSPFFRKRAFDASSGSTRLRIGIPTLKSLFFIKPTKVEQTAIATVLSDTNQLISQLEQLIAKKRNIKTGAMQELLRPKKGWEEKKLGEIVVSISSGKSNTQTQKGCYPIYGSTGIIGWKDYFDYESEKILIARVGANAGILNKVSGKYLVSDNTLILSICTNIDIDFLYFVLKRFNLNSLVFGSGQPLITAGQLKELGITFPKSKKEQTHIAQILSDMDSEIQELERQLAKYRMVKQGMIQSLLTGKIRLPLERIEQTYNQL